jgi:hypothetical protein
MIKTYRFRCGPLEATVDAEWLDQAKKKLYQLAMFGGLEEKHLADGCGLRVSLSLTPALINDDRNWTC